MGPFSFIFDYISWHYDSGSKVVWKSVTSLTRFVSRSVGAHAILKMFPVPQHLRAVGGGSFLNTLIGAAVHALALVLRLAAVGVSMAVSVVAFASGLIIFILWILLPAMIVLFVLTILREIMAELRA